MVSARQEISSRRTVGKTHFSEWDFCTACRHVQHYEQFRVSENTTYPDGSVLGDELVHGYVAQLATKLDGAPDSLASAEVVTATGEGLSPEEWLKAVDFKWSQQERQPSKHRKLRCNLQGPGQAIETTEVEIARNGWLNDAGDWVGNREQWSVWITDRFDRTVFLRHVETAQDLVRLIEAVCGYPWNPANHAYGQTWWKLPRTISRNVLSGPEANKS